MRLLSALSKGDFGFNFFKYIMQNVGAVAL